MQGLNYCIEFGFNSVCMLHFNTGALVCKCLFFMYKEMETSEITCRCEMQSEEND